MQWKKHRLMISFAVLGVLSMLLVWAMVSRNQSNREAETEYDETLPKVEASALRSIEVNFPKQSDIKTPMIRVEKQKDDQWQVVKPLRADADKDGIQSAIEKLSDFNIASIAATQATSHAALGVDEAQALHITASTAKGVVLDVLMGEVRDGNTMLREKGKNTVYAVRGSLRYAFNKDTKDWRDRKVTDLEVDKIQGINFTSKQGSYGFVKEDTGWKQNLGKPVRQLDVSKVGLLVSTLASITATDFASADADQASLGFATEAVAFSKVVIDYAADKKEDEAQSLTLWVGNSVTASESSDDAAAADKNRDRYLKRSDSDIVYIVSSGLIDQLAPAESAFQADKKEEAPPAAIPSALGGTGASLGY